MACGLLARCSFYQACKSGERRGWEFLISGYCEGRYDWLCCKRRYFDITGAIAPAEIEPIGVLPPELVITSDFLDPEFGAYPGK